MKMTRSPQANFIEATQRAMVHCGRQVKAGYWAPTWSLSIAEVIMRRAFSYFSQLFRHRKEEQDKTVETCGFKFAHYQNGRNLSIKKTVSN